MIYVLFFTVGLVLGAGLVLAVWRVLAYLDRRDERLIQQLRELNRVQTKSYPSEVEKNGLANESEMPDNSRVIQPESPAIPGEQKKRPFWEDPEQLKAVRDRLAQAEVGIDEEALEGLTPHEQWKRLDQRLLDLEGIDL